MHLYGVSPLCKRIWFLRLFAYPNCRPQIEQLYDLSPVWTRQCTSSWPFWANFFLHILHSNGFSPVCVRKCMTRFLLHGNLAPHSEHSCGFLQLCWGIWRSYCFFSVKHLLHTRHWNGSMPLGVLVCLFRLYYCRFSPANLWLASPSRDGNICYFLMSLVVYCLRSLSPQYFWRIIISGKAVLWYVTISGRAALPCIAVSGEAVLPCFTVSHRATTSHATVDGFLVAQLLSGPTQCSTKAYRDGVTLKIKHLPG